MVDTRFGLYAWRQSLEAGLHSARLLDGWHTQRDSNVWVKSSGDVG
jgi:hypothetical protein